MIESAFLEFAHNAALLLALALLFDQVSLKWRINQTYLQKVVIGLVVGGIGILIMMSPLVGTSGVVVDAHSILLGISGLFFGSMSTIIAMVITAGLHVYMGSAGVVMSISVIMVTGTIGILWRRLFKRSPTRMSAREFYIFGMVVHIAMLLMTFTLPVQTALQILASISLPVLIIYPIGTMLLGMLMATRMRREMQVDKIFESETRYKIVADNTFDWEYWYNPAGKFEYCSPSCLDISGYSPEEFMNNPGISWKMIHPDDMEVYRKHRESQAEEKKGRQVDFRIIRPDGSIRWIGHVCRPVYDNSGQYMGTRGSNRDITEQKLIQEALRESEEKYRSLTEQISDVVWTMDGKTLYFTYVSPSMENLRGYSTEEIMAVPAFDTFPSDLKKIRSDLVRSRAKSFLNGTQPKDKVYIDEVLQPCKDGSSVWTEIKTSYYLNEKTGHVFLRGVTRDISERKIAEIALRDSEEKYRLVVENQTDWIAKTDAEGKYTYANPAFCDVFGKTEEELIGNIYNPTPHPEDAAIIQNTWANLLKPPYEFNLDARFMTKQGWLWANWTARSIMDEEGKVGSIILSGRDITERKEAVEKLQAAQTELQKLLAEADQSRRVLLSVVEDRKTAEDAARTLSQELIEAYDATLLGWSNTLDLREHETAQHSKRVVDYTVEIARRLGLSEEEILNAQRGALLHDIGKMGVPDSILLKPGPLSDDEWVIMKMHPIFAFNLLSEIPYLQSALDIPYAHHERWNGKGYPLGLKETNIPLSARIFAVVDVWDALSTERPYRPAWNKEAVVKYLRDQAGIQFDPKIVDTFLEILEKPLNSNNEQEIHH